MLRTLTFQKCCRSFSLAAAFAVIAAITACSPTAAPQPTAFPSPLPLATKTAAPTATEMPTAAPTAAATATATAAATAAPTATSTPTAAPTFGPAVENSLSGWCLPEGVSVAYIESPLTPYPDSRIGTAVNGAFEVRNLPAAACTFVYTFNQPAPQGLTLAVYSGDSGEPWLTAPLEALEGQPESAAATLTHTYITAFPFWQTAYRFAVLDAGGTEVRSDPVNLYRWQPELCWNGQLPDLNTLRCPLQQDLHPWDAGYGTPFPTPKPSE